MLIYRKLILSLTFCIVSCPAMESPKQSGVKATPPNTQMHNTKTQPNPVVHEIKKKDLKNHQLGQISLTNIGMLGLILFMALIGLSQQQLS